MAGKNRSSSSTTFDPELKNAALQVFRRGDVLSRQRFQPYDSATVAPLAPSQLEGMQMGANAARSGIGQDQLAQANTAAGRAAGFTPSFFDVNLGMDVPDVASRDISADQIGPFGVLSPQQTQGRTVDAQSLAGVDLSPYQNQYQTQVIDTALGDIERSRLMAQNQNAADAIKANAFGGDRQAILESETNKGFADQAARTAVTLRAQGFENAASRAEADIGRAQQAGFQTANLGAQSDLANQSASLAAGQQNLNAELARQQSNQQQNLAAQRNNAQLGFDAARSNQQAALEAETQRRSLESQLALDRERQNLSALGINLQGAGALGQLGGQARDFAFGDAAALESVGDRQRQSAQELLEDRYRRFLEQRDAPLRAFDILRAGAGILPSPVMQSQKGRGFTVLGG